MRAGIKEKPPELVEAYDVHVDDGLREWRRGPFPAAEKPAPKAPKPRARRGPPPVFSEEAPVDAHFGRWYRGVVDEVVRDAAGKVTAYEIRWENGDSYKASAGKARARLIFPN